MTSIFAFETIPDRSVPNGIRRMLDVYDRMASGDRTPSVKLKIQMANDPGALLKLARQMPPESTGFYTGITDRTPLTAGQLIEERSVKQPVARPSQVTTVLDQLLDVVKTEGFDEETLKLIDLNALATRAANVMVTMLGYNGDVTQALPFPDVKRYLADLAQMSDEWQTFRLELEFSEFSSGQTSSSLSLGYSDEDGSMQLFAAVNNCADEEAAIAHFRERTGLPFE